MGKIITLPGGVKFDPETGELIGADFGRPSIPSNSSYSYSSDNWWSRINNFVIGIGNWFAEHNSSITGTLALILLVLAWLYFAISVIGIWREDGFFSALIFGIIGGVIFYYVSMIAAGILIWVGVMVLAIVRFIFYNIYTLIITIAIVVGLVCCKGTPNSTSYSNNNTSSYIADIKTERFICTARTSLRIHREPYLQSPVIGKIPNGQYVNVFPNNSYDEFVKVQYGNTEGWASIKYLSKR